MQGTHLKYNPQYSAESERFLFGTQIHDNVFWTCASGVTIWTAYEYILYYHSSRQTEDLATVVPMIDWIDGWMDCPVYNFTWLCLITFWRDVHFYFTHRLLHWKPLYRRIHYLHHCNVNPGPWSGLSMHPIEHVLYFSVVLIHIWVKSHPLHFLFDCQHTALTAAHGHIGYDAIEIGRVSDDANNKSSNDQSYKLPTGALFHYLHHRYFDCNYGETSVPLDKWFGTYNDGTPAAPTNGVQAVAANVKHE
jgi:sterol desaturase/sphingolipid hydroxylase (fatty acid hydroxylase superfamily)